MENRDLKIWKLLDSGKSYEFIERRVLSDDNTFGLVASSRVRDTMFCEQARDRILTFKEFLQCGFPIQNGEKAPLILVTGVYDSHIIEVMYRLGEEKSLCITEVYM